MHRPSMTGTQKLGLVAALAASILPAGAGRLFEGPLNLPTIGRRPGKHSRMRTSRGVRERTTHLRKVCNSSRGRAAFRGKINFRRSDPRHPMYDALRSRGWTLFDPRVHDLVGDELVLKPSSVVQFMQIYEYPFLVIAAKGAHRVTPAEAFAIAAAKDSTVKIPVCMR